MDRLSIKKMIEDYKDKSDWKVYENSNAGYSYPALYSHISGEVVAQYTLDNIYPDDISELHREGFFHIHDLANGFVGYCAGHSLRDLLELGFVGIGDKSNTKPAKHFSSILGQIINFLGTLQLEWAGAQAFNSVDTYLAPFIKEDNLSYNQVKQNLQEFIFSVNSRSRWGQSVFSNFSFDVVCPVDLKDSPVIIGGKLKDGSYYKDYQKEMDMFNKAFLEVMIEGDVDGKLLPFPIPTYNITKDFDWESEFSDLLFAVTAKYGVPYFQNFINSDLNPEDVRSLCCRLSLNLKELRHKTGGLFGAGDKVGSIGVVTINMPRVGYLSDNDVDFYDRFNYLIDKAAESLMIKRKAVQEMYDRNMLPFTKIYLHTFANHFNTIGVLGMNECCENFLGKSITTPKGHKFSCEVLDHLNKRIKEYQEATEYVWNSEASPAEGTCYRLAKIDKAMFPDIVTAGTDEPYYTNSSHLPVNYTNDIIEALDLQEDLQCKYTGGTVFHSFLGERIEDPQQAKNFVKMVFNNYKIPYLTITPTFSICKNHGYLNGWEDVCPDCGEPTEVYSRINGYIRSVSNWNKGKKEEFKERNTYNV